MQETLQQLYHDHYILTHKFSNNISVILSKGSEFYSLPSDTCNTTTLICMTDRSPKNISNGLRRKNTHRAVSSIAQRVSGLCFYL
jgi:hypothetical protein